MSNVIFDLNPIYLEPTCLFVYVRVSGDGSYFGLRVFGVDLNGFPVADDLRYATSYSWASEEGYGRPATRRLQFLRNGTLPPASYKAVLSDAYGNTVAVT